MSKYKAIYLNTNNETVLFTYEADGYSTALVKALDHKYRSMELESFWVSEVIKIGK